jgi:hypothetical protein
VHLEKGANSQNGNEIVSFFTIFNYFLCSILILIIRKFPAMFFGTTLYATFPFTIAIYSEYINSFFLLAICFFKKKFSNHFLKLSSHRFFNAGFCRELVLNKNLYYGRRPVSELQKNKIINRSVGGLCGFLTG